MARTYLDPDSKKLAIKNLWDSLGNLNTNTDVKTVKEVLLMFKVWLLRKYL